MVGCRLGYGSGGGRGWGWRRGVMVFDRAPFVGLGVGSRTHAPVYFHPPAQYRCRHSFGSWVTIMSIHPVTPGDGRTKHPYPVFFSATTPVPNGESGSVFET